ncbi:MAG TPA: sulfatase-like hydrolase/transferase [Planctomycetota bacterium]|nr:sulfatase-like hydrolase/transferase [Planctomycetota bacterium]HRR78724.1 sulfatase-like hydrolase/transferase [Planctomycetota bacterium]HRT96027.1 sulfatase-like hydrolase/transferase [Planctomycetota bacterium]
MARTLNRRRFLEATGIAAASLAGRGAARAAEAPPRRPNVVFLFTDDQREDTVAALGNPHIKTPNLDALARSGIVFRNAYCMGGFSAAVCLPSRMMMLRGRAWFSARNLPPGFPNLPTAMNEAGYETWHLGKKSNTDLEVQKLFTHSHYLDDEGDRKSGFPCKALVDGATAFLKTRDAAKPFFMYLAPGNPHDPRVAEKRYLEMYEADKIPLPPNFAPFHPFDSGDLLIRDERLAPWPRTEAEVRRHLHEYYAVITGMDEQVRRLVAALKEAGEFDNTIFIFSSDQGIAIGSHGLMGKQNLYEHTMGVPLFFSGPGVPQGKTVDAFAYLFDLFPTVCDLVGATVPEGLDGKSLAPVIQGKAESVRDTIFLAYLGIQRAVRRGNWKLIRYPQVNRTQLFDLEADPHETRDMSADPAQATRVKELLALMAEQQKLFGDTQPLDVPNPAPAEITLDFFERAKAAPKAKARPEAK